MQIGWTQGHKETSDFGDYGTWLDLKAETVEEAFDLGLFIAGDWDDYDVIIRHESQSVSFRLFEKPKKMKTTKKPIAAKDKREYLKSKGWKRSDFNNEEYWNHRERKFISPMGVSLSWAYKLATSTNEKK